MPELRNVYDPVGKPGPGLCVPGLPGALPRVHGDEQRRVDHTAEEEAREETDASGGREPLRPEDFVD